MFRAMSHRRKCMCNFSYIYTYKSWPCLKMKDSKRQNSMYKPDVRCKEMIFFLYRREQVALIFKGNATHHRNLLFLYSVVGFVNMPVFFFPPKAKKSETKPSNLCCHETEARFLSSI